MLEPDGGDVASVEQHGGVVKQAILAPWRADQNPRTAVIGLGGQFVDAFLDGVLEGALEDKVLGRVAGNRKLPADHQIGAGFRCLGSGGADAVQVAVDIADGRIDLR